jgi:hypothetical protein
MAKSFSLTSSPADIYEIWMLPQQSVPGERATSGVTRILREREHTLNHMADDSSTSNIMLSRSLRFRSFKRKATSTSISAASLYSQRPVASAIPRDDQPTNDRSPQPLSNFDLGHAWATCSLQCYWIFVWRQDYTISPSFLLRKWQDKVRHVAPINHRL